MARLREEHQVEIHYATPLMHAVAFSFHEGARLLLQEGADAGAANSGGATALMMASALDDRVLVNLLLAFGAYPDDQLEDAAFLFPPGCAERRAEVARWLPRDARGATALWLSACAGSTAVVERLLIEGADTGLEATCEALPGADEDEKTCAPYRAAELLGRGKVTAVFEKAAEGSDDPHSSAGGGDRGGRAFSR